MSDLILVTGATGYIGGRLIPRLLAAGYRVRAMVRRDPERLFNQPWARQIEIVVADVLEPQTLANAFAGVTAAYYLIHSMRAGDEFRVRDRQAACNFARAAEQAGLERLIYLGGLGQSDTDLSHHLASRQETGELLRQFATPVTEFRAAVVVGSGSVSFEMVRSLTERLPVMIHPRWADTRIQPIAIRDVLAYLVLTLAKPESADKIIEIGGATVTTYGDMMRTYAKIRGLKRWIIRVPLLTPRLSSYWVHWTTPIPASFAQPLIEGARNETIVHGDLAQQLYPEIRPITYEYAVERALAKVDSGNIDTIWNDAVASSQGDSPPFTFTEEQGMLIERRERRVAASPQSVFAAFSGLGGERGWPPYQWLWVLRGWLDRAVGGVGLRRGRRHPDELWVGDAVDFWRVEAVEPDHMVRLRAEMKLPGNAWLQFETMHSGDDTKLVQTAYFAPKGLLGYLYWYALYPMHGPIFSRMIDYVATTAENQGISTVAAG
ncbi:MAG: SDR family oxidoreductase [Anaerolineae bacterium]|nr:SDR family oxidoreductase [Anaerolineae bacterium]